MLSLFSRSGAQCFVAQMNVQKAEMLERLSTARNFSNLDDEDNCTAASKAVRQVRPNTPLYEFFKNITFNLMEWCILVTES